MHVQGHSDSGCYSSTFSVHWSYKTASPTINYRLNCSRKRKPVYWQKRVGENKKTNSFMDAAGRYFQNSTNWTDDLLHFNLQQLLDCLLVSEGSTSETETNMRRGLKSIVWKILYWAVEWWNIKRISATWSCLDFSDLCNIIVKFKIKNVIVNWSKKRGITNSCKEYNMGYFCFKMQFQRDYIMFLFWLRTFINMACETTRFVPFAPSCVSHHTCH